MFQDYVSGCQSVLKGDTNVWYKEMVCKCLKHKPLEDQVKPQHDCKIVYQGEMNQLKQKQPLETVRFVQVSYFVLFLRL